MPRKVFSLNQILDIPKQSGVYFLFSSEGELLYIGQSVNLNNRIKNHEREHRLGLKYNRVIVQEIDRVFDRVARIEIELMNKYQMLSREAFAIDWFEPSLNGITNSWIDELRREGLLEQYQDHLKRKEEEVFSNVSKFE